MRLFNSGERDFTSQGLGPMDEGTLSVYATVAVNGQDEIELVYSIHGNRYKDIATGMFITCQNEDGGEEQPYRIYAISKPKNGKIRINAQHWCYDLIGIPVAPCSGVGIAAALEAIKTHSIVPHAFDVWTDIDTTTGNYNQTIPKSFMECLMGSEGSILDVFHGSSLEFKFDHNTVKAYSHLGSNRGVRIEYGKNMVDFKSVEDVTSQYTGCVAYWQDYDTGRVVYGNVAYSSNHESFDTEQVFVYDASSDFEEEPTVESLTNRASEYVTDNNFGESKVTIECSFINLADSPEYSYLQNLIRVKRGDTVTVYHRDYGITYEAEVIKTAWDPMLKRYRSITIGSKPSSITSTLKQSVVTALQPQVDQIETALGRAISQGTEKIRGGLGGYVVINTNADGLPNEILIMDTPDIATAVHVIRLNREGIGFSNDGYDGEYRTAWLIDGTFYADNITAGTLEGALLRAGSVLTDALNVTARNVIKGWSTNFWTDTDGLHIARYDTENMRPIGTYQSLFSDVGMRVIENNTGDATLIAEGDSVTANNFTAYNFMIIDPGEYKARFQGYSNTTEDSKQIGCFWIE